MNLTADLIEKLSEKAVRRFLARMPTHSYMRDDLKQEARIAIAIKASTWNENGGANLETYTYMYARRAMQEHCTQMAGPVSKPMVQGDYSGTRYEDGHETGEVDWRSPETFADLRDADRIVKEFIERRMESFTGKGKLTLETIRNALTDMISGDSCRETAKRYGCSAQRMSMLAVQAGIS